MPVIAAPKTQAVAFPSSKNGTAKRAETDVEREYVISQNDFYRAFRTLPPSNEKVLKDFTPEKAVEMLTDGEVHAAVEVLVNMILPDEVQLVPATDKSDPRFQKAVERVRFHQKNLENLSRSLIRTLKILIRNAIVRGVAAAELVFRVETSGELRGSLVIDRIKVKENKNFAFVVDEFDNVLGLIGKTRESSSLTLNDVSQIIPREKFLLVGFYALSEDPRCESLLRAAYSACKDKADSRRQFWVWRRAVAIRSLIGFTPEKAREEIVRHDDGTPKLDTAGNAVVQSPAEAMLARLVTMQTSEHAVAVFPFGSQLMEIGTDGDGSQFTSSLNFDNQEIRKAILLQTLATGEGEHQARAASEEHGDVLDSYVTNLRGMLAESIRTDVLNTVDAINFAADNDLVPYVLLADAQNTDIAVEATAFGRVGYKIAPEHLPEVDARLGLTRREMTEQDFDETADDEPDDEDETQEQDENEK